MAKPRLIDILKPLNQPLSLPPDLDEAFHSLPGIGILSACQRGDQTQTAWGCPHLLVTLPRGINPDRKDLQRIFGPKGILALLMDNALGKNAIMLYPSDEGEEWVDDSEWWQAVLSGLRSFALSDYRLIGPFDVYYGWILDPSHEYAESFALVILDQVSGAGINMEFQVVGAQFMSLNFWCEHLSENPDSFKAEIKHRMRHGAGYEEYNGMGFDQVVDMIMQLAENMEGFPWSRQEVRNSLMTALHRCAQFSG